MGDTIGSEDEAAVEVSPAPPHPRSESAAISRERAGGSPRPQTRDSIDELVDASLKRGPTRHYDKCPHCNNPWHGIKSAGCRGGWRET